MEDLLFFEKLYNFSLDYYILQDYKEILDYWNHQCFTFWRVNRSIFLAYIQLGESPLNIRHALPKSRGEEVWLEILLKFGITKSV